VKAILAILGVTVKLFIRGVGYSNSMLCIYTVPRGMGTSPEIGTSSINLAKLSRFYLKTETESSL
jgi:hypothetical protein